MDRDWQSDLSQAPMVVLLYLQVDPADVPEQVASADVAGFRLEDGWFVLDANCKRIKCASVSAWAEVRQRPPRE